MGGGQAKRRESVNEKAPRRAPAPTEGDIKGTEVSVPGSAHQGLRKGSHLSLQQT